jgi:hypothetical protein
MRRSSRGKYNKDGRSKMSEDELLSYLRTNNFHSRLQLRRGRKPGEPTDNDCVKCFGSWSNTITRAFGNESFLLYDPNDKNYYIKCVIEFDLWDSNRYRDIRKKNKDIIPAFHTMERVWKRFINLRNAAQDINVRRINQQYLKLRRRLGRKATPDECKEAGIVLTTAVKFFGGRWKYEDYIDDLEAAYNARKARGDGEVL